jgi:hypothetical protein
MPQPTTLPLTESYVKLARYYSTQNQKECTVTNKNRCSRGLYFCRTETPPRPQTDDIFSILSVRGVPWILPGGGGDAHFWLTSHTCISSYIYMGHGTFCKNVQTLPIFSVLIEEGPPVCFLVYVHCAVGGR